jgi:hypothetical protein
MPALEIARQAREHQVHRLVFAHIGRPALRAIDAGQSLPFGEWGLPGRTYELTPRRQYPPSAAERRWLAPAGRSARPITGTSLCDMLAGEIRHSSCSRRQHSVVKPLKCVSNPARDAADHTVRGGLDPAGGAGGNGEADQPHDGARQPGRVLSLFSQRRLASMESDSRSSTSSDPSLSVSMVLSRTDFAPFLSRQARWALRAATGSTGHIAPLTPCSPSSRACDYADLIGPSAAADKEFPYEVGITRRSA